jgi:hypothetical protein
LGRLLFSSPFARQLNSPIGLLLKHLATDWNQESRNGDSTDCISPAYTSWVELAIGLERRTGVAENRAGLDTGAVEALRETDIGEVEIELTGFPNSFQGYIPRVQR